MPAISEYSGFVSSLILLLLAVCFTACTTSVGKTNSATYRATEAVVVIGIDRSQSVKSYKPCDTVFIRAVCNAISYDGGLVVVYGIGNPTDKCGIRCYIKPVPIEKEGLVLSKKAELRQKINAIRRENEEAINRFVKATYEQIISTGSGVENTDINGFFKKVDVLSDEPSINSLDKIIFCYSDGVQSIGGKNSPAHYNFRLKSQITLCLAGWKTKVPCDSIKVQKFESPEGFLQYLTTTFSNH